MQDRPSESSTPSNKIIASNHSQSRRISTSEIMAVIAPGIAPDVAKNLIEGFCQIFVRTRSQSIVASGDDPRGWLTNRRPLSTDDVARHLVGGQISDMPPKWIGTRSLPNSSHFVIDIDSDRQIPGQVVDSNARPTLNRTTPSIPTFEERCSWVEQCLSRLGIDAHVPQHVLRQSTPSGGIHLYVFLDKMHPLEEIRLLLEDAGIGFNKGQAEFFPSTSYGLRLPFGHLPGQVNDPTAWHRFVRDYRSGKVRRFSLQALRDHLSASGYVSAPLSKAQPTPLPGKQNAPSSLSAAGGKCDAKVQLSPSGCLTSASSRLSSSRPKVSCQADIERIWQEGIVKVGTRNEILKDLAAHLIFIKGNSAVQAEKILVDWALNPRHNSKDIQDDLKNGGSKVADGIAMLCAWYERKRNAN